MRARLIPPPTKTKVVIAPNEKVYILVALLSKLSCFHLQQKSTL
jgi:hypothetical protein